MGPKITAHLMKKSVKKFGKRKAGEEVKAEEAEKPVEAAEELEETQEVLKRSYMINADSETEGGE